MKPIFNTVPHIPEKGLYGDCHRVVIASLLELEAHEVPHFYNCPDGEKPPYCVEEFLNSKGYSQLEVLFPGEISFEDLMQTQQYLNPNIYYILGGTSIKECGHSVICKGGEIVHDPSGSDIVGPMTCKDGSRYWWLTFIVPLLMKAV